MNWVGFFPPLGFIDTTVYLSLFANTFKLFVEAFLEFLVCL